MITKWKAHSQDVQCNDASCALSSFQKLESVVNTCPEVPNWPFLHCQQYSVVEYHHCFCVKSKMPTPHVLKPPSDSSIWKDWDQNGTLKSLAGSSELSTAVKIEGNRGKIEIRDLRKAAAAERPANTRSLAIKAQLQTATRLRMQLLSGQLDISVAL